MLHAFGSQQMVTGKVSTVKTAACFILLLVTYIGVQVSMMPSQSADWLSGAYPCNYFVCVCVCVCMRA